MTSSRIFMVLLAASLSSACAGAESGESPRAAANRVWSVGTDLVDKEWDSGKTADLSPWKLITCYSTYGTDYLLTGLHAFEDAGSADHFIARLGGECSGYSESSGTWMQDGRREVDVIFTANHKTPGEWTKVSDDHYAIGVKLETDMFGDYVKSVRFHTVSEINPGVLGSYSNPGATAAVGPVGLPVGPQVDVDCDDQYVVAALSVQYDVTKGKIRKVRVGCRPLTDN